MPPNVLVVVFKEKEILYTKKICDLIFSPVSFCVFNIFFLYSVFEVKTFVLNLSLCDMLTLYSMIMPFDAFEIQHIWEHSGSMVKCLNQDQGAAGSSLTGVTAVWSLSKPHLS